MEETLLTAGLVCIIAAIVGGSLKAFGAEVPALQSVRRQIMLGVFGVILLGVLVAIHWSGRDRTEPTAPHAPVAPKGISSPPIASPAASPLAEAQRLLAAIGFYDGPADGIAGPRTVDAIKAFQRAQRLPPDGTPGSQTLARLKQVAAERR